MRVDIRLGFKEDGAERRGQDIFYNHPQHVRVTLCMDAQIDHNHAVWLCTNPLMKIYAQADLVKELNLSLCLMMGVRNSGKWSRHLQRDGSIQLLTERTHARAKRRRIITLIVGGRGRPRSTPKTVLVKIQAFLNKSFRLFALFKYQF
jgi:hypothetical protein